MISIVLDVRNVLGGRYYPEMYGKVPYLCDSSLLGALNLPYFKNWTAIRPRRGGIDEQLDECGVGVGKGSRGYFQPAAPLIRSAIVPGQSLFKPLCNVKRCSIYKN